MLHPLCVYLGIKAAYRAFLGRLRGAIDALVMLAFTGSVHKMSSFLFKFSGICLGEKFVKDGAAGRCSLGYVPQAIPVEELGQLTVGHVNAANSGLALTVCSRNGYDIAHLQGNVSDICIRAAGVAVIAAILKLHLYKI